MCKQSAQVDIDARVKVIEDEAEDKVFKLPQDCDSKFVQSRIDSLCRYAKGVIGGNRLVLKGLSKSTRKLLATHRFLRSV